MNNRSRYVVSLIVFGLLFAFSAVFAESDSPSKGGVLEIEVLKLYQETRSHAAIDIRFVNSSHDDIQHWLIGVELYDKVGKYLAYSQGMVSHIRTGQFKVEQITFLDTQASQVGSWKATLGGVVGYSGLREDRKYTMKVKK